MQNTLTLIKSARNSISFANFVNQMDSSSEAVEFFIDRSAVCYSLAEKNLFDKLDASFISEELENNIVEDEEVRIINNIDDILNLNDEDSKEIGKINIKELIKEKEGIDRFNLFFNKDTVKYFLSTIQIPEKISP